MALAFFLWGGGDKIIEISTRTVENEKMKRGRRIRAIYSQKTTMGS